MRVVVGVDVGTSGTKVVACDEAGGVLASASAAHEICHARPGWSEQDPRWWWEAACAAMREVCAAAPVRAGQVAGVGLSGQMHGSVFLDGTALEGPQRAQGAEPIRPALLWNDQRTAAECEQIERAAGGRLALVTKVGNAALPGFTAPKMLWLREHEPANFARVAAVCLPKDYVRLRLTGALGTDVGDASGTLLFDPAARAWRPDVCESIGLDAGLLPRAHESAAVAGRVMGAAAARTGAPEGTPVAAGSGDNMTSAVGCGVIEPGQVAAVLGTSGVIICHADRPAVDDDAQTPGRTHTMCAADGGGSAGKAGRWVLTGCTLSAAGCLQWVRSALFPERSYDELIAEARETPPGAGGLLFLPYLTGERCPHPDPTARGAFVGLTARHTRGHLVRAVVEGVCLTMAQILEIMRAEGVRPESIRLTGGAAKSSFWRQTLADATGCEVVTMIAEEGPAYGAAILAAVGAGVFESVSEACGAWISERKRIGPGADAARYAAPGRVHAGLYHDLRARFAELHRIDEAS